MNTELHNLRHVTRPLVLHHTQVDPLTLTLTLLGNETFVIDYERPCKVLVWYGMQGKLSLVSKENVGEWPTYNGHALLSLHLEIHEH